MNTCPDCTDVKEQVKGNDKYEVVDIGEHVRNLKEFLRLRDKNPAFDVMKRVGSVGIPCFVLEDGTVTFRADKAGLQPPVRKKDNHAALTEADARTLLVPIYVIVYANTIRRQ